MNSGIRSGIQISVHCYMVSITEYDYVINNKHVHKMVPSSHFQYKKPSGIEDVIVRIHQE